MGLEFVHQNDSALTKSTRQDSHVQILRRIVQAEPETEAASFWMNEYFPFSGINDYNLETAETTCKCITLAPYNMWHMPPLTALPRSVIKNNSMSFLRTFCQCCRFKWQIKVGTSREGRATTHIHQCWSRSGGRRSHQGMSSGIDWPRQYIAHHFGTGSKDTHRPRRRTAALADEAYFDNI